MSLINTTFSKGTVGKKKEEGYASKHFIRYDEQ